ncbi:hypothetical protein [Lacticaseibacillus salsurivasis]|uniref:hypothetical protein n=1 Tax=Lacticaseibacillus salsurivasis TaxID=3081441 RepID=UPI0030C68301
MKLIKLDSGDYINTEFIAWMGIDHRHADRITVSTTEISANLYQITSADRERIVEAMKDHHTPNFTALGEVYGALEMVNQGMKDGTQYSDIDGILHVLRIGIGGEDK